MIEFNKDSWWKNWVVVLVLAIVFAGVLVSAFSRRNGTGQARQAEEFMRLVRNEQEDRCFDGKRYASSPRYLKSFLKHDKQSKLVAYDLTSGEGISVHSGVYGYTLQMPSYADGRICCNNCNKLSRKYSSCRSLQRRPDFIETDPGCRSFDAVKKPEEDASPVTDKEGKKPVAKNMADTQEFVDQEEDFYEDQEDDDFSDDPRVALADVAAADVAKPEEETQPQDACQPLAEKGTFYMESCSNYQAGTQGSVLFTWNKETCSYDAVQNCILPSRWEALRTQTHHEEGLYPSDVDTLCDRLLQEHPCEDFVKLGEECYVSSETCYTSCTLSEKIAVPETSNIVLYNVTASLKARRCAPVKNVTVQIP
ncbi:MAG: hypothetical protein J6X06_02055 [Elusimicrobiaceae bacterium]|nr:hypothetical protein [Elusimicrobiaceae bacterium]